MTETYSFESDKYQFHFCSGKDRRGYLSSVIVDILPIERRDTVDKDEEEIRSFLADIGKWETFVTAGKGLFEDLGLELKGKEVYGRMSFGIEKYKIEYERDTRGVRVVVKLAEEESLRRTKGESKYNPPSIEEIVEQVKNVPKWQALKRSTFELRGKLS